MHSAKRASYSCRLVHRWNSSTAPRTVPFISMSVIMLPDTARCCWNSDLPLCNSRSFCILAMHLRASSFPIFWRLQM